MLVSILRRRREELSMPDRARKRKARLESRAKRVYGEDGEKKLKPDQQEMFRQEQESPKTKEQYVVKLNVVVLADNNTEAEEEVVKLLKNNKVIKVNIEKPGESV